VLKSLREIPFTRALRLGFLVRRKWKVVLFFLLGRWWIVRIIRREEEVGWRWS